jgi:hypothetical protein
MLPCNLLSGLEDDFILPFRFTGSLIDYLDENVKIFYAFDRNQKVIYEIGRNNH